MKATMTYHARVERKTRLEYIIDTVSIGNPIARVIDDHDDTLWKTLTDTGVIIISNRYTNKLVTAYIATIDQATYLYKADKKTKFLPDGLYHRICKNQKFIRNQPKG